MPNEVGIEYTPEAHGIQGSKLHPDVQAQVGWIMHSPAEIRDMVYRAQASIKELRDQIAASDWQQKPRFDMRAYNDFLRRWQAFWDALKNESWPYIENNSDSTYDKAREFYDQNQRWRVLAHDAGLVEKASDAVAPPKEVKSSPFTLGVGTGTVATIAIIAGAVYVLSRR